jgi:phosphoglycolate phosphatase
VWDWNGTLLDDHEHCVAVMNVLLREEGLLELDVDRYRTLFDFPVRSYYERLGFSLDADRWEELSARFITDYDRGVHQCALHEGATEVLGGLHRAGTRNTILSAARRTSVESLLAQYRIEHFFDEIIGLDDHYAAGKSDLGIEWSGSTGVPPETVLLVGDTVHDYEVAEAMGVRCVLVARGHHSRERLGRCGCPVVDALTDIFD